MLSLHLHLLLLLLVQLFLNVLVGAERCEFVALHHGAHECFGDVVLACSWLHVDLVSCSSGLQQEPKHFVLLGDDLVFLEFGVEVLEPLQLLGCLDFGCFGIFVNCLYLFEQHLGDVVLASSALRTFRSGALDSGAKDPHEILHVLLHPLVFVSLARAHGVQG